ncbi:MAG: hypothetical protein WBX01_02150 [Nitrososphaeraceae archaeon]
MTEEHRRHISEAQRIKCNKPEVRKQISIRMRTWYKTHRHSMLGKKQKPEYIQKATEGRKKFYKKNGIWNKGKRWSEQTKNNISKGMRKYWDKKRKQQQKDGARDYCNLCYMRTVILYSISNRDIILPLLKFLFT